MGDDTVEAMADFPTGTWSKRGVTTMDGLPAASVLSGWPTRGLCAAPWLAPMSPDLSRVGIGSHYQAVVLLCDFSSRRPLVRDSLRLSDSCCFMGGPVVSILLLERHRCHVQCLYDFVLFLFQTKQSAAFLGLLLVF